MKKRHLSQFISMVLSFFIMVCLTVIIIFSCLAVTVFRADFFTRLMDDGYYRSVMNSLTQTLKQKLSIPSNIPAEVFDNLFSYHLISEDIKSNLNAKLAGIENGYDKNRVRANVIETLKSYAEEKGAFIADENLQTFADYCMDEYDRHVNIFFLDSFAVYRKMFDNLFTYILLFFSIVLILLSLFLFHMHEFKHRALRFCACSLISSAVMLIPLPLILLVQGVYKKINITPEFTKFLIVESVNKVLMSLILSGLAAAVAGATAIVLCSRMREKMIKGHHKY